MSARYHAVVWIDHREARIFYFDSHAADGRTVRSESLTPHLHHKASSIGDGRAAEDHDFLQRTAAALADAAAILITGPANEKAELAKHIERHDPALLKRIVGVETLDHPSDPALVAAARAYFRADHQAPPRSH